MKFCEPIFIHLRISLHRMYHLTQFDIHQFRGFRNLHLEQLGQVNLLVGMNNSGKTSVLEAISLYCCSTDVTEWLSTVYRRRAPRSFGPFRPSPSMIEALKWLFPREHSNSHGNIKMTAQGSFQVREVQATPVPSARC
jgi:AAA domain